MAIEFRCTQCNKLLRTGDDTAGKRVKCPDCGTISEIPTPEIDLPIAPPPELPEGKRATPDPRSEFLRATAPPPGTGERMPPIPPPVPSRGPPEGATTASRFAPGRSDVENPYEPPPEYRQPPQGQPPAATVYVTTESRTDAPGVISLIFGVLAVLLVLLGCVTCGVTYPLAVIFALVGAVVAFFGQGNLRVAAIVLNLLALIPALLLFIFSVIAAIAAATAEPPTGW